MKPEKLFLRLIPFIIVAFAVMGFLFGRIYERAIVEPYIYNWEYYRWDWVKQNKMEYYCDSTLHIQFDGLYPKYSIELPPMNLIPPKGYR